MTTQAQCMPGCPAAQKQGRESTTSLHVQHFQPWNHIFFPPLSASSCSCTCLPSPSDTTHNTTHSPLPPAHIDIPTRCCVVGVVTDRLELVSRARSAFCISALHCTALRPSAILPPRALCLPSSSQAPEIPAAQPTGTTHDRPPATSHTVSSKSDRTPPAPHCASPNGGASLPEPSGSDRPFSQPNATLLTPPSVRRPLSDQVLLVTRAHRPRRTTTSHKAASLPHTHTGREKKNGPPVQRFPIAPSSKEKNRHCLNSNNSL
jgi:hypothetical protein